MACSMFSCKDWLASFSKHHTCVLLKRVCMKHMRLCAIGGGRSCQTYTEYSLALVCQKRHIISSSAESGKVLQRAQDLSMAASSGAVQQGVAAGSLSQHPLCSSDACNPWGRQMYPMRNYVLWRLMRPISCQMRLWLRPGCCCRALKKSQGQQAV